MLIHNINYAIIGS